MSGAIYTVGHSTHSIDAFLALLTMHGVTLVCDVRSQPYSRVNPQFNKDRFQQSLNDHSIGYQFLGRELGARSDDASVYVNGTVCYDLLAKTARFQSGLDQVAAAAKKSRLALMCAERDPLLCHRMILIGRHLAQAGYPVVHILGDGRLETHEEAVVHLLRLLRFPESDLFRSRHDIIEKAYTIQGARIAYAPRKAVPHQRG